MTITRRHDRVYRVYESDKIRDYARVGNFKIHCQNIVLLKLCCIVLLNISNSYLLIQLIL